MNPIFCDNCKKPCPNSYGQRKAYFSTTVYGGRLCCTSCSLSWILNCKQKKIKGKKVVKQEGNIKIVYTRNRSNI